MALHAVPRGDSDMAASCACKAVQGNLVLEGKGL